MNQQYLDIINKIKDIKHLHSDSQVAKVLNMTRNNLYAFKNRTNLPLKQLHTFCSQEGIRIDYLINGTLPIYESNASGIAEPQPAYARAVGESPPLDVGELIKQAHAVLTSDTGFKNALELNIKEFYRGVKMEETLKQNKGETKKQVDPPDAATEDRSGAAPKNAAK